MKFTILIPHYKVGRMTAYCISQILKFSNRKEVEVVVIDNSNGLGIEYLKPFSNDITILNYPPNLMQSHGISLDWALLQGCVRTDYFIVLESDSFPTIKGWLDWYREVIGHGGTTTGSILSLSGGRYLHPASALYKKSDWKEAYYYIQTIPYRYFPNMGMKEGFPCHLMVSNEWVGEICQNPEKHGIDLHSSYQLINPGQRLEMAINYEPIGNGVFHNGMGRNQEAFSTYRFRDMLTYCKDTLLQGDEENIIYRMGYEPGQWFAYWLMAMNKPVFEIPTKVVWLPGRENQQQEYTLTVNGVKHLWGMTAYNGQKIDGLEDIITHKNSLLDELYESLPTEQKLLK